MVFYVEGSLLTTGENLVLSIYVFQCPGTLLYVYCIYVHEMLPLYIISPSQISRSSDAVTHEETATQECKHFNNMTHLS